MQSPQKYCKIIIIRLINLQVRNCDNKSMQRKPPQSLPTEQTEDCSSQENPRVTFINSLDEAKIIDVWSENFHEEIQKISVLTKKYNIIAIDTQFPSIQQYNDKLVYLTESEHEKYLRVTKNVDNTALIQLGMCLADENGNVPGERFCWQFNFKFEGEIESISSSSAYLLKKAGIDFEKLRSQGISYKTFTHEFIKSGLLLNKRNKWVVFHGGYDFSYMLKLIRNQCSPKLSEDFYKSIKIYFPEKIDLKVIIQKEKKLRKLGLSKLAYALQCSRIGPQHQAGSDALLTLRCYFKIKKDFTHLFDESIQTQNKIFGIGAIQPKQFQPQVYAQYWQSYPYLSQQNWELIQQNFIFYQHFNQYSQNQVFMINQTYQHQIDPSYHKFVELQNDSNQTCHNEMGKGFYNEQVNEQSECERDKKKE